MSGPVAIANNVERPLSFSDSKKSLDSLASNEQNRVNELNVEVSHDSSESRAINISLPNGEFYSGSLLGSVPQGSGTYVWSNGCKYEGEWICGMRHGHGKLQWPSGALYEGEFSAGYIHGTGTYTRGDNLVYKGPWRLNLKHGLGYQTFPNGDVFEGSWIKGTPEGPGKYIWANGNIYFGNMKSGKMSGQGILTWINGDLIEGNWLNGMMHGFGVYTWIDGGCYVGTWTRGVKDGKGTFYPKGSRVPAGQKLYLNALRKQGLLADLRKQNLVPDIHNAINLDSGDVKTGRIKSFGRILSGKHLRGNLLNFDQSSKTNISPEKNATSSGTDAVFEWGDKEDDMSAPILEREYMQGVLISELVLSNRSSSSSRKANRRQKRLARDIKKPGEQIIKGHRSYDLMLCLQLGIRFTVGKINHIQRREVTETDYGPRASLWMNFPKEGSPVTPPHLSEDFKWKDYSPMVFRNLREMFKIDTADYMMSICGSDALRELSSPGKSGSVFFLSQDGRFMIKTLRKSELKVLLRMLPNYHHHVQTYENTLITKCFGLHMIKPTGGQKFRFVVMGSIFCTELRIHKRFDLKGSSLGRSADKIEIEESTVLKDLDLDYCFYLEPSWRAYLLQQIEIDSKFLESENIMDYSLLLGVHYRAPQHLRSLMCYRHSLPLDGLEIVAENESMEDEVSPQGLVLVPRAPDDSSVVVIGPHVRGGPLKASGSTGDEEVDLLLPGTARLQIQLGVNLPARAEHIPGNDDIQIFDGVYDVVLYMGIIDILQEYNMSKKIEHAYKSTQFDSKSISAVAPTYYSQRFLAFIQKIFPSNAAAAGSNT